jgi:molybdopterin-guanine dinucleotide biosynthesis protein A
MSADLEAFVLIGGGSKRFGSDKGFFEYEGETLASKAANTIEAAFPGIRTTFVAASKDQFGIKKERLIRPVIFDLRKGFGAWSGVDAALSHSGAEWTLVLACDLPFVTPEFLRRIAEARQWETEAVVPCDAEGGIQPLCGIYLTSAVHAIVRQRMNSGEDLAPLRELAKVVTTVVIDAADGELRNVNTPADLDNSIFPS